MGSSFRHFSADEIEAGIRYADQELHMRLDRDTLRRLANDTGKRWYANGRKPNLLQQAKREILLAELWQRDRCEAERRDAYSSAVSKVFSGRAHHARIQRKDTAHPRADPIGLDPSVIGMDPKGQYVFLFPQT